MRTTRKIALTMGTLGIIGWISTTAAQDAPAAQDQRPDPQQAESHAGSSAFVRDVRRATQTFQDVNAAIAAGYASTRNCVSGPNGGAMGVHFVNEALVADGAIDAQRPEILVYSPENGRLRLAAVEYFVPAELWDAANEGPPVVGGQLFNFAGAPNRLRSPAYYELHVWAWKRNPDGTFADWNPTVSCIGYAGPTSAEAATPGAAHAH